MDEIFIKNNLPIGRMISPSKSLYKRLHPDNEVYFNANIFILGKGKIWYGDLDITMDKEKLQSIAKEIGQDLFILREMDGRFENEILSDLEIIKRSICKINK